MSENNFLDRLILYVDAHYVENAVDFVCDEVTEHTQDDLDDPFTILSESVSCRYELEGDEADSQEHNRIPKMNAIFAGLEKKLTPEAFADFLSKSGFSLSRSSREDLVIEYCVQNGIYEPDTINEFLGELSLPLLAQAV